MKISKSEFMNLKEIPRQDRDEKTRRCHSERQRRISGSQGKMSKSVGWLCYTLPNSPNG